VRDRVDEASGAHEHAGVVFTFRAVHAADENVPVMCASGPAQLEKLAQLMTTSNVPARLPSGFTVETVMVPEMPSYETAFPQPLP
jgi:hypothetical protein